MNRTALLLATLLIGCASEPQVVQEELPILALPEKPVFDCSEIKWYYIGEKLALDVKDFQTLLKCEVANKSYAKNLKNQILYYRRGK